MRPYLKNIIEPFPVLWHLLLGGSSSDGKTCFICTEQFVDFKMKHYLKLNFKENRLKPENRCQNKYFQSNPTVLNVIKLQ